MKKDYNLVKGFDLKFSRPEDPAPYLKRIAKAEDWSDLPEAYEIYKRVEPKLGNHIRYLEPNTELQKKLATRQNKELRLTNQVLEVDEDYETLLEKISSNIPKN